MTHLVETIRSTQSWVQYCILPPVVLGKFLFLRLHEHCLVKSRQNCPRYLIASTGKAWLDQEWGEQGKRQLELSLASA